MSGKNVVLSYYDCLLRKDDVNLLHGPQWLNDALIGFYFEYLEHKLSEKLPEKQHQFRFVSPELMQILKFTDVTDYPAFLDNLNTQYFDYVFFPLNDCESRDAAGGSHWSLLVYSKNDRCCFHLDSCPGTNAQAARDVAPKIIEYAVRKIIGDSGSYQPKKDLCQELPCPRQENGYDCGLFVLCFVDAITQQVRPTQLIVNKPNIRDCKFSGVPSLVRTKREQLLSLIEELKKSHSL